MSASLAIVVPVFNEVESLPALHQRLRQVANHRAGDTEIVYVNDGSSDGTDALLDQLATESGVTVIHLTRNFGQTAAIAAGIRHTTSDLIAMLDADLQNDPDDIPLLIDELGDDCDVAQGWRRNRKDRFLDRRLPSLVANRLVSLATGVPVRDLGCTLRVMRREVASELRLYGDMHRFITILAWKQGARIREIPVRHHERQFGRSKYGIARTFRVILDLLTIVYLTRFTVNPMRLFGTLGLCCWAGGAASAAATVIMKFGSGTDITGNPLLYLALFAFTSGLQLFSLGLLGEVGTRIYFESQDRTPYSIRRIARADDQGEVPFGSRRVAA